jgi:hypothetical protein
MCSTCQGTRLSRLVAWRYRDYFARCHDMAVRVESHDTPAGRACHPRSPVACRRFSFQGSEADLRFGALPSPIVRCDPSVDLQAVAVGWPGPLTEPGPAAKKLSTVSVITHSVGRDQN